jgi:hypothetical protein
MNRRCHFSVCPTPPGQLTRGHGRCGRCNTAWYCSTECAKGDWTQHKVNFVCMFCFF